MENKTHYRKVFKSDHLSTYDLEDFIENGVNLQFTIKNVKSYDLTEGKGVKVAGKMISANIAFFKEPIKPMVLNAGNSDIMAKLTGSSFVDDWNNIPVELYIQKGIKFGKETVQGIRIKESKPQGLNEKDIKIVTAKIAACLTLPELTNLYNADVKHKTNPELVELFKLRNHELTGQTV